MDDYIDIKDYLQDYLRFLKNHKLKSAYRNTKELHQNLKKYIHRANKLRGGADNLLKTSEKANEINEIFLMYKNLNEDIPSLKDKYLKLANRIDNLSSKIKDIDINDLNINKINRTELDKVIISLDGQDGNINTEEFKEPIRYYKIKPIDYEKFKSKNYPDLVISNIEKRIKDVPSTIETNDPRLLQIKNDIDQFNKKILGLGSKIKIKIDEFDMELKNFEEMVGFIYHEKDIKKVDPKNFNGELTRVIKNNFLKNTNVEDKLTLVEEIIDISKKQSLLQAGGGDRETTQNTSSRVTTLFSVSDLGNMIMKTKTEKDYLYQLIDEYEKKILEVNENNKYITGHILYLTAMATGELFGDNYYVFDYVQKSTIHYYYVIVKNILDIYKKDKDETKTISGDFDYVRDRITLLKLHSFLGKLDHKTDPVEIISINDCTGETYNRFILLNYYKPILEDYRDKGLNKISMYARINDIGGLINPKCNDNTKCKEIFDGQKFFMSDYEKSIFKGKEESNSTLMHINEKACDKVEFSSENFDYDNTCSKDNKELRAIEFSDVFDSTQYPLNTGLSQYMGLNTQLSRKSDHKNGIALMTYGYSGTGKTYTLFGGKDKNGKNSNGILQETLKQISGLQTVYFRLYEVYGYGLTYPHYWRQGLNNISHKIFAYEIDRNSNNSLCFTSVKPYSASPEPGEDSMAKFVDYYTSPDHKTYLKIPGDSVKDVFNNFSEFMGTVEAFRQNKELLSRMCSLDKSVQISEHEKRRIRDTNNNIVSSRSILIYDFIIETNDGGTVRNVPFIIIDLPGREEIIPTYVEPYFGEKGKMIKELYGLGKYGTSQHLNLDYDMLELKMLFSLMALNPIGMALFDPKKIIDFFNNSLEKTDRKQILEKERKIEYEVDWSESLDETNIKNIPGTNHKSIKKGSEEFVLNSETTQIIGLLKKQQILDFRFVDEIINYSAGQLNLICQIDPSKSHIILREGTKLFGYDSSDQQYGLICIHLINRLLMMGRFDIMYGICKDITDRYLNKYLIKGIDKKIQNTTVKSVFAELQKEEFKRELISKIKDEDKNNKDVLKNIIKNDYYLTPCEGIYINENIAGIIKYLSTHKSLIPDDKKRDKQNEALKSMKQDENLDFQKQQKLVRMWLLESDVRSLVSTANFFNMESEILEKIKTTERALVTKIMQKTNKEIKELETGKNSDVRKVEEILKSLDIVPRALFKKNLGKLSFDHPNLKHEYDKVKNIYKSDHIFNFDDTLIHDIIEPYIKDISDYKVLYLFGNYLDETNGNAREMKCDPQYKLLKNTKNFVCNIVKPTDVTDVI